MEGKGQSKTAEPFSASPLRKRLAQIIALLLHKSEVVPHLFKMAPTVSPILERETQDVALLGGLAAPIPVTSQV